ncbi:immunoglobulin-like domain-containing protein [uncultured Duncaniella sp.]|nr:immunoglobulin-like domain-containing protein [uncultured Duncaniella sp.]
MMLDLWFGKQPHFLGEKIIIPEPMKQKSYSTNDGLTMSIVNLDNIKMPVDSIVVEMKNNSDNEATFGEYYNLEKYDNGKWVDLPYNDKIRKLLEEDGVEMVFNDVGYPVRPHSVRRYSNRTKAYNETLVPGHYRLSKKFSYPPYPTLKSDTAYVEFEIR